MCLQLESIALVNSCSAIVYHTHGRCICPSDCLKVDIAQVVVAVVVTRASRDRGLCNTSYNLVPMNSGGCWEGFEHMQQFV
jgi:hypothetical protein